MTRQGKRAGFAPGFSTENAVPHARHRDAEFHHHHSHASTSHHSGDHHLLAIEHLTVSFDMYDSDAPFFAAERRSHEQLHGLSLSVHEGEVLAVVGASGSGKSLLADAIMGLYEPNACVTGTIWFDGELMDAKKLPQLRGRGISFVPQSVEHLDPLMRVGDQMIGACARADRERRRQRMRAFMEAYGLDASVERMYPYELSGGMARRVLLICALMDEPCLIVADEPTPGLDLDIAVHAVEDLRTFADGGGGVLLITHDIDLALTVADRVAVFHGGTIVEETSASSFASPDTLRHPFSRALWRAMPQHGFAVPSGSANGGCA